MKIRKYMHYLIFLIILKKNFPTIQIWALWGAQAIQVGIMMMTCEFRL